MRVVASLLLLLFLAPATALVLEDPAGDARVMAQDVGQPIPAGRFAAIDTLGLDVLETRDNVTLVLHVADAAPEDLVPLVEATTHHVTWRLGATTYELRILRQTDTDTGVLASGAYAFLQRWNEGDSLDTQVARPEVVVDADADTYTVVLARSDLVDASGAPALPGDTLDEVRVRSEATFLDLVGPYNELLDALGSIAGVDPPDVRATVIDRMPDDGSGAYEVRLGGGEHHGLGLSASEPNRASNGEATTMLFTMRLRNDQADAVPVHFRADGVPDGWDVWFPAEGATLDAGEARDVPVLARMPFVHEHGARQEFTVRAEHADDASVYGETTLGVVFTEVPQPSGHHPRLWLHSAASDNVFLLDGLVLGQGAEGYLNAQEDHGDDAPVRADLVADRGYAAGWDLPLHPGLGMGLDFDVDGTGALEFPVRTGDQPMTGARLHGLLVHVDGDGAETVLATLEDDAAAVALASGTPHTFTATLTPEPAADRVPYEPSAGLRLRVWLDRPDPAEQQLAKLVGPDVGMVPGGTLDLPLREYHDDVDDAFGDLLALRLDADVRERAVNPGEATLFEVRVQNLGATDRALTLGLSGQNAAWATVTPPRLAVPAGGEATSTVAVRVPADAVDGEQADLVLEASGGDDVRALLRLVARVDTTADHEDLSDLVPAATARDSPGAPVPLLAAGLAAAAVALRRRDA